MHFEESPQLPPYLQVSLARFPAGFFYMARPSLPWAEIHDRPTNTRLNEHYDGALHYLAKKRDIPAATLSRMLLIKEIDRLMAEDKAKDTS